jgi:chitin disaccharide deacetylase
MAAGRFLIVNADDFGQGPGVNRGIIEAHERGVVTSASLMVRWPAAAEAAAYARAHPALGIGLHLDLGEWAFRLGEWRPVYEVVPRGDAAAVSEEWRRQLGRFRELVGRDPDHLDSHQHVHREGVAAEVAAALARSLGVPLRHARPGVAYCGQFYGQTGEGDPYPEGIGVARLLDLIAGLPPGVTELACHPGEADDLDTMYRAERVLEVRALCDPRVREALDAAQVALLSFRDVTPDGRVRAEARRPAVRRGIESST